MLELFQKKTIINKETGEIIKCLVPYGELAEKALDKWKDDKVHGITAKEVRSPQQHNKFFAMVEIAMENAKGDFENIKNPNEFRRKALREAGHFKLIDFVESKTVNTKAKNILKILSENGLDFTHKEDLSIAWHVMGQKEFNQIFQDVETFFIQEGMLSEGWDD